MTDEITQPAETWLNDPVSLESGEPAQPAESPEALLAHLQRMPMTEWVWTDAQRIFAVLAASTARPTERGAVENARRLALEDAEHLEKIADQADENNWEDWGASMRQAALHFRAALTPPVTVAATDQAGEVERAAVAIAKVLGIDLHEQCAAESEGSCDSGTCPGALTEDHDTDEHRERIYRMARAALATQPATGRTMGGEEDPVYERRAGWENDGVVIHESDMKAAHEITAKGRIGYGESIRRGEDFVERVEAVALGHALARAALQNGGE